MPVALGAIADDVTGASDLAAILSRSGRPVMLRFGVPADPPSEVAPFEILALKIRTAPTGEAIAAARAALAWLRAAGTSRFYWKYCSTFDSTPQGNIGPVAEALMADIGADQTIYCPAFPENGRTIFMGHLFVGDQLLAESPMKDHPLTPMRDSNLLRLLSPQVTSKPGLVDWQTVARGPRALTARLQQLKAKGAAHVIVDAIANADLSTLAEATLEFPLLTGGSALAQPMPALLERSGLLPPPSTAVRPAIGEGKVILSGSCSAMTLRQVARHAAKASAFRLDPLTLAKDGLGPAVAWLAAQPLTGAKILYATAEPEEVRRAQAALGAAESGALVESALASLAREALKLGVRRLIVAGGETSGAIVQALGITRLSIGPEIAPGVPWTFGVTGDGISVALALKSGNFGAESFFEDAWAILEGG